VSDTSRDQQPDGPTGGRDEPRWGAGDPADEPTTGPPAGASQPEPAPEAGRPPGNAAGRPSGARAAATGKRRSGGPLGWLRGVLGRGDATAPGTATATQPGPEEDVRQRRRRRWFVAGISAAAALVVIALCAGTVGVISAVGDFRDRSSEAREDRRLRDSDCLDLEQRLNKLVPPGATTTPQARAVAVRDENSAVRIYVNAIRDRRDQEGWRELLDARTSYAEALDLQAKSRAPAFYVAPRTADGLAVSDQLVRWSPAPCAGPVRRLSAPDL
jgi:hypothetical protein